MPGRARFQPDVRLSARAVSAGADLLDRGNRIGMNRNMAAS